MDKKKALRIAGIVAAILIAIYTFSVLTDSTRGYDEVETSVALEQITDKNAKEVQINDREQQVQIKLKEPISVDGKDDIEQIIASYPARTSGDIFNAVKGAETEKFNTKVTQDSFLGTLLITLLPLVLFIVLLYFLFFRMQGGGGGVGPFAMGKSRHKELNKDNPENTFDDVAGADEAVEELDEIRDFLSDPSRYEKLGAKIPRGVLLYGPPGTGKTLLARAVAGEAGVPFYSISGSDFVEMFVGVGASRVRDLFKQAKENSPCIIFVDEIDAVGRQRGSGMGGGHDEREQTLNQLLVEMDGFGDREGVILMAATNRPDILDPALLRPGRFDRQIPVTNPDLTGREQILRVHAKGKPLANDVDLKSLAKRTAGMSGADLENVLNEAALLTARVDGNVITGDALEEATDRVIGGPRRSTKIISEMEKKITAYHEGGHTLAAWALKDIDRVYKVTILARGRTGGHALTVPEDDKGMYNRSELFARLVFAMGGRAAEELVFGNPTTGASADIEMATNTARSMVMELGMSPKIGAVKYGVDDGDPFRAQGGGGGAMSKPSPEVAAIIDNEVRMLMDKAQATAYEILRDNRDYLDKLAEKLLEKETLRRPDLEAIFDGIDIREVSDVFPMQDVDRPKDGREPVKTPNELAKERGEEPPKRNDFFSAARRARMERRKAEQEKNLREAREQDQQKMQAQADHGDHVWGGQGSVPRPEQRGFRLPDHEQPDNPWTTDDAPTRQIQRAQGEPQDAHTQGAQDGPARSGATPPAQERKPQQTFPWDKPIARDSERSSRESGWNTAPEPERRGNQDPEQGTGRHAARPGWGESRQGRDISKTNDTDESKDQ
ncbi:ATP-dependent zinc metalloprotease FtsH [Corynebacterium urogenitale]|uniref:ATP-dependent zinc metalloprotease FtsH n=1 Tax=Corynebacterium urogenitale TaxID=2487892 RepID=A0A5J6Z5Y1_9CORY|nr:ATP-dependent zinc metalloprotease FtsH [Corynebacterium urogenitale]QFQ01741.1 ATP-dependent zinc metalloprotease FtsH [Corynebacterium urogenitale]